MRLQISCQRELWNLNDHTRAAMTIVLSIQGYYITDFDAFALEFRGSVHIWDGNGMVGGIHGSGGWNCLRALKRAKGTHKGCPYGDLAGAWAPTMVAPAGNVARCVWGLAGRCGACAG